MIDKDLLKRRFARAAATYDHQAEIQHRVATHLLELLDKAQATAPRRVLEIGCCTGLLTARLAARWGQTMETLYLNDLVADFLPRIEARPGMDKVCHEFLAGDVEKIALPERLDLVLSSSTLHWIEDLYALLDRLHACLRPGGWLAISLYGRDNLVEIRELTGIGLRYHELDGLGRMVGDRFEVLAAVEERHRLLLASPLAVLCHLRHTGVNAVAKEGWSPGRLRRFNEAYQERFGAVNGVPLTYHPLFLIARRRA